MGSAPRSGCFHLTLEGAEQAAIAITMLAIEHDFVASGTKLTHYRRNDRGFLPREVGCFAQGVLAECAIKSVLETIMPTRNVVLTDSQAKFVEQMVAGGHYQNASEVLREGLRLVQTREAEQAAKLVALREAVAVGIADIESGRYTELNDAASLDAYLANIADRAINAA